MVWTMEAWRRASGSLFAPSDTDRAEILVSLSPCRIPNRARLVKCARRLRRIPIGPLYLCKLSSCLSVTYRTTTVVAFGEWGEA